MKVEWEELEILNFYVSECNGTIKLQFTHIENNVS
jgi:hypothetical protein